MEQRRVNDQANCDSGCCSSKPPVSSVCQSLEELDFEKGIWQAAIDNNVQRILFLINNARVDPDSLDSYGYTALHYAARNGSIEAARCLLEHGANVNAQTRNNGATPLLRAVTANKIDMVQFLLMSKADTTVKDLDGLDALARAVKEGHSQLVSLLS